MQLVRSAKELIRLSRPDDPVFLFRPHRANIAARWFAENFPGESYYAVKANPAPHVLQALWDGGTRAFDVASEREVELIGTLFPDARMAFMHPIKNRRAIARAYHEFGVRRFVLDNHDELDKIFDATGHARDLTLVVRIGVSNEGSTLPLTGKFGVPEREAPDLLRATRAYADELGVSFHVGSQALSPLAWRSAMAHVSSLIVSAGVTVDLVDVGGGFPSVYDMHTPPPLEDYAHAVAEAFEDMMVLENADLWCEPGRALCAESESLLCRIEGVKPGALYLNDGGFGALHDAVRERWSYPARAFTREGGDAAGPLAPYTVYGPTCDSADRFPETVMLPAGLREGDYLEFGNVGAYGRAIAGRFNGFGGFQTVEATDSPWPTLYGLSAVEPETEDVSATVTQFSRSYPYR